MHGGSCVGQASPSIPSRIIGLGEGLAYRLPGMQQPDTVSHKMPSLGQLVESAIIADVKHRYLHKDDMQVRVGGEKTVTEN